MTHPPRVDGPVRPGAGFDSAVARWLRDRSREPTAADTSIDGVRNHARVVNARSRALLRPAALPRTERSVRLDLPGGGTPARVYRPDGPGPFPTITYFHGGGWIAGDLETHAQHARRLCVGVPAVVVSVDYRLAPEHRFPGAYRDCLAATRWCAEHAAELGGDASRVIVAGDSAGGQLAASVAIACRDEGLALAAQLLIVPVTDVRHAYADPRVNESYPSRSANADGYGLTTVGMREFAELYGAGASEDWRVSPVCVPSAVGLASAVVHTAGFDPLRDEGEAYAQRLAAAGVAVSHHRQPDMIHGYASFLTVGPRPRQAMAEAAGALRVGLALHRNP